MKTNILDLDGQLCHKIYIAGNSLTRLYRPHLEEINLTYPQYLVMLVLWEHKRHGAKEDLTLVEIVERSGIDKGALSLMVKKLTDKNFVKIIKDKDDRRLKHIQLTKAGNTLEKKASKVPLRMGSSFKSMTEKDFQKLNKLMVKFLKDLKNDENHTDTSC